MPSLSVGSVGGLEGVKARRLSPLSVGVEVRTIKIQVFFQLFLFAIIHKKTKETFRSTNHRDVYLKYRITQLGYIFLTNVCPFYAQM